VNRYIRVLNGKRDVKHAFAVRPAAHRLVQRLAFLPHRNDLSDNIPLPETRITVVSKQEALHDLNLACKGGTQSCKTKAHAVLSWCAFAFPDKPTKAHTIAFLESDGNPTPRSGLESYGQQNTGSYACGGIRAFFSATRTRTNLFLYVSKWT